MGKRFIKFRVSRMIPSFQSCRSKDPSSLPANPVPSFPRLPLATATATHKLNHRPRPPPPPPQSNSKHHHSSLKRHVSSALLSARRSFLGSRSSREDSHTESPSPFQFQWGNYNNYHHTPPRRKIYNSAASEKNENEHDVVFFPPLSLNNRRRRRSTRRRRRSFQKIRLSTSSDSGMIFSDDEEERENNEDEEETDTLVSTEDSTPGRRSNAAGKAKKHKRSRRWSSVQHSPEEAEDESPAPARLSEFMRKMVPCRAVEGKVRESFAVVKRSADPYEDFKRSMAEMVVEKQMFQAAELEELLHCFLSLNSDHHHEAIVRAFTEIWEALFCQSSS